VPATQEPPPEAAEAPTEPAQPDAAAPMAGPQITVFVVDGAVFRGELVEKIPGQYVTLRLSTGEHRRILWRFIARISESSDTSSAPVVQIQFRADDERAVLQKLGADSVWFDVCATPCAGKVSSTGLYRVGGSGISTSESFKIRSASHPARIDAEVATTGRRVLGGILTIGGGIVAYFAAIVFLATTAGGESDRSSEASTASGLVFLGSAAATVTGLVLLTTNDTEVSVR
jgi:hypothetical protein